MVTLILDGPKASRWKRNSERKYTQLIVFKFADKEKGQTQPVEEEKMVDSSENKAETSSSDTKMNPEDKKISNVSASTITSCNSPTRSGLFQRFDIPEKRNILINDLKVS